MAEACNMSIWGEFYSNFFRRPCRLEGVEVNVHETARQWRGVACSRCKRTKCTFEFIVETVVNSFCFRQRSSQTFWRYNYQPTSCRLFRCESISALEGRHTGGCVMPPCLGPHAGIASRHSGAAHQRLRRTEPAGASPLMPN